MPSPCTIVPSSVLPLLHCCTACPTHLPPPSPIPSRCKRRRRGCTAVVRAPPGYGGPWGGAWRGAGGGGTCRGPRARQPGLVIVGGLLWTRRRCLAMTLAPGWTCSSDQQQRCQAAWM